MALIHTSTTVGTTPTLLFTLPAGNPYTAVIIYNEDNSSIYVGDETVTTTGADKGITIRKEQFAQIWLHAREKLYAVSSVGTIPNGVTCLYSVVLD